MENDGMLLQELETLRQENRRLFSQMEERREEETRLRRSERELTDFFENAPLSLHWVNAAGTILRVNRAELEMLGYREEEYVGRCFQDFHADPAAAAELACRLQQGETLHNFPAQLSCKDGAIREVLIDASAMWENGRMLYSRCFTRDVTARRRTEAALKESMRYIQQVAETALVILYIYDLVQQRSLYTNRKIVDILGYEPGEIMQMGNVIVAHLMHPDDLAFYPEFLDRIQAAQDGEILELDYRMKRADGEWRWLHSRVTVFVRAADGSPSQILGAAEDITERRVLQEQLIQTQKMESVGRLAGGIAHDFNNLMMAILGYTHLLANNLPPEAAAQNDLQQIRKAGERAAELTQQLLGFARKQVIEPTAIHLTTLTREMEQMLRHLLGANIHLTLLPAQDLWRIRADRNQMEQALLNLVVNGRDAMPKGGHLTLEMTNVFLEPRQARNLGEGKSGEYVLLSIRDTGEGMTEAVRKRIFEPYFTTKPQGKGTGLGLATCYGIVKQNGGSILCHSELGKGTTFQIYLPRDPKESKESKAASDSGPASPCRTLLHGEESPAL